MKLRCELRAKLIILGSLALITIPATVQAENTWDNFHWERSANLTLDLGNNVSGTWDIYLNNVKDDWNISSVLDIAVVDGSTKPKKCRPEDGRVEVCSASYGNNGWLGLAQIWVSGGHITKGAVKVNDTYFDWDYYNNYPWRQYVMCQEVGHIFGLAHQDETFNNANLGSCMDYTNNPDGSEMIGSLSNLLPGDHDFAVLETIYKDHGDLDVAEPDDDSGGKGKGPPWLRGRPNVPNMPPAMNVLELDGPGQWGELISGSRDRGASTYMLDFGGGFTVITFVTWISE